MNEEIDESEFYHQDFTTASEWEIFIARMEEIIHGWQVDINKQDLGDGQKIQGNWHIKSEKVPFADVDFTLYYYKKLSAQDDPSKEDEEEKVVKNPIDNTYDFILNDGSYTTNEHCISLWYGLKEFYVIVPDNNAIVMESRIKVLLSSINIVIGNLTINMPFFVQIREKWQKCFLGIYEGEGLRTSFEMVHLKRGPQHCQYLTGLIDLFKTKIMSPVSLDPIMVSVQLTFNLKNFGSFTWKQEIPDSDSESFDSSSLCILPFGVTFDPVNALVLKTKWSHLADHMIVDSENYSDFDPMQAPFWSIMSTFSEEPICLLSDTLIDFLHLLTNNSSMYDLLGDYAAQPAAESNNPLDLLTESKVPTISSVIKRAARNSLTKNRKGVAPLSEDILVPMLYFLFPDAEEEPKFPYADKTCLEKENEANINIDAPFRGFKTCSVDSLIWRFSIVLAQALHTYGGFRALSHLWFEFVQEMRYRWEKSISIPGLGPGFPDLRTCLLHQKLQMLNCCIDRKRTRETVSTTAPDIQPNVEDSSTDDEEFFDCSTEKPEEELQGKRKEKYSLWNRPVGRLGKFEDLKLLKTGDPLYIPITQEPVPKTEDQLEEDTDVLLKLGSDAHGSELRAKMMSASLLSDMESFKAANPGSVLEDFIRWYSPRDWIEDEGTDEWGQKLGHLSSRMLLSDNTWVEMWQNAKPVAANRQKRLFDDTREAEKVLHFLDSRTMSQICEMLLSVLSQVALCRLAEECSQVTAELPEVTETLKHIHKTVERLTREGKVSTRRYEVLIQEIGQLELCISQVNSLLYKLNPSGATNTEVSEFVKNLIVGKELEIQNQHNSHIGERILAILSEAQQTTNMVTTEQSHGNTLEMKGPFPQANIREFVMRAVASRPAIYSSKSSQFLRVILSKKEFRLAGAFSEDTVFF